MRLEVDVLAMSATPIPRTLHMSLSGLRDISVITTPPRGRRPIKTHVGEFDEELIAAALRREHAREGQSFYLHNRVETIDEAAARVRSWVPELRVGVAHGQMPERRLEDVMLAFLRGDYDVLVSTTIIESGLDIPQANTLMVERADTLGLSQLYQIRGRVGRSDVTAHAYLFYPDRRELSEEARHRLSTLADYTELGLGVPDRDARPGAARRRQPARRRAVGARGRGRVRAVLRAAGRGGRRAAGRGRPAAAAGARGRPGRRLRARPSYVSLEAVKIDLHRRLALAGAASPTCASCGRGSRPVRPAARSGREPVRRSTRRGCWPAELGAEVVVVRGGKLTVSPLRMDSTQVREMKQRVPQAIYSVAAREVSRQARAPTEFQPQTQYAGGIGGARCYTRIAPPDSGVTCFYESLPDNSPPCTARRGRGFRGLWRWQQRRFQRLAGERRRRRRRQYAHHPEAARPADRLPGELGQGRQAEASPRPVPPPTRRRWSTRSCSGWSPTRRSRTSPRSWA